MYINPNDLFGGAAATVVPPPAPPAPYPTSCPKCGYGDAWAGDPPICKNAACRAGWFRAAAELPPPAAVAPDTAEHEQQPGLDVNPSPEPPQAAAQQESGLEEAGQPATPAPARQASRNPNEAAVVDLFGEVAKPSFKNILQSRFIQSPFSVLSAREGGWQERIRSELGRGEVQGNLAHVRAIQKAGKAAPGGSMMHAMDYSSGNRGDGKGRAVSIHTRFNSYRNAESGKIDDASVETWVTSSIFAPVLCELCYKWFSPPDGHVLDPFAGGSVRGIVAAAMGRRYVGIDLRPEQVEANRLQADTILGEVDEGRPRWVCGDSREVLTHDAVRGEYDFIMSCPPYGDLEVYSDDPKDISNMGDAAFRDAYVDIIAKSCAMLKRDRFAVFVVGDYRDGSGALTDFIGLTVNAFKAAGMSYYNDIVLVTVVGSLPIRATKQFNAGRKVGRTHQMVLVFCKGDGKRATKACGDIEVLG